MLQILLLLFIVLVFVIVATTKFKIQPFITLIIAAIFVGLLSGINGTTVIEIISEGFGKTLSSIGVIIAFGAIIGVYLEKSGGTMVLANSLLKRIGEKRAPLTMNITGLIVSIPVFCDSGFVILSSLNKALSKKTGIPLTVFAIALATGLYVSHVFVPPTPGPLAAAAVLNADLGMVLLLGLAVAIPTSIAGLIWAKYIGKFIKVKESEEVLHEEDLKDTPPVFLAFAPIFIPIILIGFRSVVNYPTHPFGEGLVLNLANIIGNPIIALLIGLIIASFLGKKTNKEEKFKWVTGALKEAGLIILVTGAGGAFGNILRATNIGELLGEQFSGMQVGILLPFIIAAILKTAQGSSTVAIITTAAIIAPLIEALGINTEMAKALAVLSIGAGAMTVSHINDSYFWVVSQFSDLDLKSALKSHTIATLIQGVTAIILITIMSKIF